MSTQELRIDDEFAALIPPLTDMNTAAWSKASSLRAAATLLSLGTASSLTAITVFALTVMF